MTRVGLAVHVRPRPARLWRSGRAASRGVGAVETALSLSAQTEPADTGRAAWLLTLREGDVVIADGLETVRAAAPRLRLPACWVPVQTVPARIDLEQGRPLLRVLGTPEPQPAERRPQRRLLRRRGLIGLAAAAVLVASGRANTAPFDGTPVVIVPVPEPVPDPVREPGRPSAGPLSPAAG